MKLFDFTTTYPNEESCMLKFKQIRDKVGVVCPKCGCKHHYWLESHKQYQCKHCGHRMNLRAGTALHGSKLPYRYWFITFHLLTATKHTFSASEIQRQLGHKRYQPIWEMVHKIRSVMGQRDEEYTLLNEVELDEGFFSTEIIDSEKNETLKRGVGSQAKTKVLVMAESTEEINPRYQNKPRKVGHIKMIVLPDLKSQTINGLAETNIDKDSVIYTDACKSHSNFKNMFKEHHSEVIEPKEIGKKLPWVHIAISNAKTTLADTYHGVKREFLQSYLDEFCYKFNRRYFGEDLFEKLIMVNAGYTTKFQHKTYAKSA